MKLDNDFILDWVADLEVGLTVAGLVALIFHFGGHPELALGMFIAICILQVLRSVAVSLLSPRRDP